MTRKRINDACIFIVKYSLGYWLIITSVDLYVVSMSLFFFLPLFPCFLFCHWTSLVSQPCKRQASSLCFVFIQRSQCWKSNFYCHAGSAVQKTLACVFHQITPLRSTICRYFMLLMSRSLFTAIRRCIWSSFYILIYIFEHCNIQACNIRMHACAALLSHSSVLWRFGDWSEPMSSSGTAVRFCSILSSLF